MDPDEITYNPFYHLLRNEFRKTYDFVISNCWTICIPRVNTLQAALVTHKFFDDHVLKPHPELPFHFTSIGEDDSQTYRLDGTWLELVPNDEYDDTQSTDTYKVKITATEKGYNKEYQPYLILILDKPLRPEYDKCRNSLEDEVKLNSDVTCYNEALSFLNEFSDCTRSLLVKLKSELKSINMDDYGSAQELNYALSDLTRRYWAAIMRKHRLELQCDARFQKLLSTSLEVFIMHTLHRPIYSLLSDDLSREDRVLNDKVNRLIEAGVTPDQLGADESLAILLPAAVVELATLDAREGPLEKLLCLRTTLELIVAEVKAALADVAARNGDEIRDSSSPRSSFSLSASALVALLAHVIVKSRPRRLITDLHYVQNFLWSVSPRDGLSHCLATYQAAVSALYLVQLQLLPHRSEKVKTELPMAELLEIVSRSTEENHGEWTPIDTQVHQLATMLEKCTQNR